MASEKNRRRFRRSRYAETIKIKTLQLHHHKQHLIDQPSISIDTDRNLDLDLRQTGSRSDPDRENRRSSRSPQRRPSFRSINLPKKIIETSLIILDEAPMMKRKVFECVSRSMSDLTVCSKPFGGKVVVLGGDFR